MERVAPDTGGSHLNTFLTRVETGAAVVGVVGQGYVGLPLAVEAARSGFRSIGFDVDPAVVAAVNAGRSRIQDVEPEVVSALVGEGLLEATVDLDRVGECDALLICVPTPLNKIKDPDLSYVVAAVNTVLCALRPGQLVVLESTTYPGTTREVVLPILERSGLEAGSEFFLCYSPERVDPGNRVWRTRNTPKVLGGLTSSCAEAGSALYGRIFETVVPVESPEAAELVKVYENTFRMINIALVNELAQVCDRLDIDVWSVIDAAATKPFGFMKFMPGPGLGGHCIPLDPHFLSWKMRSLAFKTRMIELASEINAEMPVFVVRKVMGELNRQSRALRGSRVMVLGVTYKRDVGDLRESPALEIIRLLKDGGAHVVYHDPYCPEIPPGGSAWHDAAGPMRSAELTDALLEAVDAVVIVTDHSCVDYERVARHASIVVDTRGVLRNVSGRARVVSLAGTPGRSPAPPVEARSG